MWSPARRASRASRRARYRAIRRRPIRSRLDASAGAATRARIGAPYRLVIFHHALLPSAAAARAPRGRTLYEGDFRRDECLAALDTQMSGRRRQLVEAVAAPGGELAGGEAVGGRQQRQRKMRPHRWTQRWARRRNTSTRNAACSCRGVTTGSQLPTGRRRANYRIKGTKARWNGATTATVHSASVTCADRVAKAGVYVQGDCERSRLLTYDLMRAELGEPSSSASSTSRSASTSCPQTPRCAAATRCWPNDPALAPSAFVTLHTDEIDVAARYLLYLGVPSALVALMLLLLLLLPCGGGDKDSQRRERTLPPLEGTELMDLASGLAYHVDDESELPTGCRRSCSSVATEAGRDGREWRDRPGRGSARQGCSTVSTS